MVNYARENDSGTGWGWSYANKTLVLDNLQFTTTNPVAMKLPAGATIILNTGTSSSVTSTF